VCILMFLSSLSAVTIAFFYDRELYISLSFVGNRHKLVFLEQSSPPSVVYGTLVTVHGYYTHDM
jgi:hypothetical protein